jgi:peptidoglycan/LPS O-acetylase OafA/YrhL
LAAVIVRNPKALTVAKKSLRWIFSTAIVTLGGVILVQRSADSSLTPMAVLGYSALAAIYGCFVLVAYASTGSATRIAAALRNPVLKAFGKYSYGIYVIHNPIAYYMNSVVARLGAPFTPTGKALVWLCSVPLGISASFLLALMSWSLLEKRFLRMKHRFEPTL